ncbi:serine hydroxymethyltransferase [Candidatus Falkowbacteria bacterium CG_4_10_14_0_2_um_filter_41_15]|uniref:Serine hydroxymethyltransferase n=3 Tax=Candidatus Falkowiibacteriota TaxID=1752728 RepID=A0A2G9ZMN3_9BACT|nr:MAG: serine hydroxymethyltransferase [Candidatus Falkowbacteria bacterium CG1_02_41_21]PIP34435.1 MAG: serine hydroxymethyltransferase [Candidatus Falkowbacteria bacterium CG23_combo_of_CG06-09_8_20_14_all_41_10]PJA10517.1 MAG: serine hydroxymethyltransferase [Candidatus Falkowbacteria bacterium CG_4_10_14_0_2_um_filter_41_15]
MPQYNFLKNQDPAAWEIVAEESRRQDEELELIASENYVSPAVLEAMATVLANKYSEGYSGKRYYGGNEVIDKMEDLAIARAKELFAAPHVNVQPLSGSPANAAVYMAFLEPGDKVLGLRLDHGGHLSHGHSVNFSGRLYNFIQYGLNPATGRIDMDEVYRLAKEAKPKMIVAGFSAYSREIDWQRFKEIADEVGAYTFADIAHIAGLVAAGVLANPVPFFDVVSTTTHKTLRGPRGAIIMCQEKFAKQVDRAVFPGMQGGPHDHITAAKAVAFGEALKPEFKEYAKKIIVNARAMAANFLALDYKIISGGTDNHLFVLDLSHKGLSGKEAEKVLETVGISVSRSTIPDDPNPPMNPSGVRIGTPAVTTRGMGEAEIKMIVNFIDSAITHKDDLGYLNNLKTDVRNLCLQFPTPK